MQHNKHNDDLDYLSQRGFEELPASDADIEDLKRSVRNKTFSYNNSAYFSMISLVVGVFIGISVFFTLYETPPDHIAFKRFPVTKDSIFREEKRTAPVIVLDTVSVVKENFIRPAHKNLKTEMPAEAASPGLSETDSVISIPARDIDVSSILNSPANEEKIKFITNAPVFYIHNLKVTDYTLLYFKKNRFVRSGDIAAPYQNRDDATQSPSGLKQSADYFLHNEIADALLYFKKGKYDRCIYLLDLVSDYNKEDINCDFYLGMCYYYKKNFSRSVVLLDRCIVNPNNTFLQEAMYYKAMALFEAGNKDEALKLFKQIADEGEFYAVKANEFLRDRR